MRQSMEQIIKVKKGQILIQEGDESKDMYLLRSGLLKVYKKIPNQNENYTIKLIKPNEKCNYNIVCRYARVEGVCVVCLKKAKKCTDGGIIIKKFDSLKK